MRKFFALVLLTSLGTAGCHEVKTLSSQVVNCGEQAMLEAVVALMPTILTVLEGESLDQAKDDTIKLGEKYGIGAVACTVSAVQSDLSKSISSSSQPVLLPATVRALNNANALLTTTLPATKW